MSDKRRYWFVIDKGKLEYVQDKVTGENITVTELEDLVNEQQDIISQLQNLCGKSDYENAKLRLKNKELQKIVKEELGE